MRILIRVTYITIISLCFFMIWFSFYRKVPIEPKIIPEFQYKDTYGDTISSNCIDLSTQKLIIYLSPECNFCSKEIEVLIHWEKLSRYQIILIFQHGTDKELLNKFIERYSLLDFGNIQVLIDENNQFPQQFYENKIPSTFLFDTNNKLILKKKGFMNVNDL